MTTLSLYHHYIRQSGQGGFLCPPTHPTHTESVKTTYRGRGCGHASLEYVATHPDEYDAEIARTCQRKLDEWNNAKPPLTDPAVQEWILQCMGYFRGCYQGPQDDETSWYASNVIIRPSTNPADVVAHAEWHCGVHCVRKYYPEFELTVNIVRNAYWGTKPE